MKIINMLMSLILTGSSVLGFSQEENQTTKLYTIEQFLNTKVYAGGTFTFDEKKILFSSDETGVFNVYSLDLSSHKQKALTHSDTHSIFVLTAFPEDERFLYTCDELGNERNHLFLWENEHTVKDLTPYPGAKSEFEGWCHDQKSFLFSSNVRDPKFMDLYEMDIATLTPKLIYKNDQGLRFDCMSADKRYLALHKSISSHQTEVYVYDLLENKLIPIVAKQKEISSVAVDFSLDSKILYFVTDEDSEFNYLNQYHMDSRKVDTLEKYDWDISSGCFSKSHRYRITAINADGKTIVKVYDQKTQQELKLPKMPEGDISRVTISRSEKYMLLSVDGSCSPNNLYIYNLEEGTAQRLTQSLSPEINAQDLVEGEVIRFSSYDGMLIPAFYYKPYQVKNQKIPALIWVHGGPGGQSRGGYNYLIQYLVNHGYAILAINNRGSSGYGKTFYKAADRKHGDADLDDCMWAKKFLISTGYIDENKVGIMGGSYGGYMTLAALAFRPQEMAIGVDIFGVSNWVRTLKSFPSWWAAEVDSLYQKIGHPDIDAEYLESISPLFHAKNIVKPLMVLQGANDPRVLKIESDQIIEAVSKNGVPYRYLVFDDEGHGFLKKQNRMIAGKAILEFLDEHLK